MERFRALIIKDDDDDDDDDANYINSGRGGVGVMGFRVWNGRNVNCS